MTGRPVLRLSRPLARQEPRKAPGPHSEVAAPLKSSQNGSEELPAWFRQAELMRRLAQHPLPGLPSGPKGQVRPLPPETAAALRLHLEALGASKSAAAKCRRGLNRYKLTRSYTRACLRPGAVTVDLFTGADVGPVSDRQRADAERRFALLSGEPDPAAPAAAKPETLNTK